MTVSTTERQAEPAVPDLEDNRKVSFEQDQACVHEPGDELGIMVTKWPNGVLERHHPDNKTRITSGTGATERQRTTTRTTPSSTPVAAPPAMVRANARTKRRCPGAPRSSAPTEQEKPRGVSATGKSFRSTSTTPTRPPRDSALGTALGRNVKRASRSIRRSSITSTASRRASPTRTDMTCQRPRSGGPWTASRNNGRLRWPPASTGPAHGAPVFVYASVRRILHRHRSLLRRVPQNIGAIRFSYGA